MKIAKISPEKEVEALRIIDKMTPEELDAMEAFEKEFDRSRRRCRRFCSSS